MSPGKAANVAFTQTLMDLSEEPPAALNGSFLESVPHPNTRPLFSVAIMSTLQAKKGKVFTMENRSVFPKIPTGQSEFEALGFLDHVAYLAIVKTNGIPFWGFR